MAVQEEKRTVMLTESPGRLMVSMSLPGIVGMVVIGLYTFVDAVYAGQLIGVDAMGAVSVAYPFTFINSGLATMLGMGSASVLSRAIGARNQRVIDQVMGNLTVAVVVASLVVAVLGIAFARPLLMLTGAEGQMLDMAVVYLRILFAGSLFVNFAQSSNMIMRGEGELVRAMGIMGGGAVLNMILAPLFILALRDQGLGIEGAGIATVLSQFVLAGVMLWWFLKREKTARMTKLAIVPEIMSEVLKVGVSGMLMQVLTLVQSAIVYRSAAEWGGSEWLVLFGAAMRVQAFAFIPLWGMSNGFQPVAGTNFGAERYDRVRKATAAFCLGATVLALVFYVPVMLAPDAALSLFITDPAIVAAGAADFRVYFSTYVVMGVMVMGITLFQAVGQGGKAAILALARPVLLFVPLVLIVPRLFGLGVHGVWLACALTDVVLTVAAAITMVAVLRRMGGRADAARSAEACGAPVEREEPARA
ncbi:MATE family efflux transporter [Paraeggerthella hongkongensis]|uniref:Multidrug export protein MepA n=1 Tax=Paraeggerthella hongkongensis TaxID=230658 RepID=A0A3N0BHD0_9ACTN|nr:MATE family efflux transporter [Paraeggerthella hongkongensis]RNL46863.1 MATE family efflux transporter [Paraeggerthella hongkongensis]